MYFFLKKQKQRKAEYFSYSDFQALVGLNLDLILGIWDSNLWPNNNSMFSLLTVCLKVCLTFMMLRLISISLG